MLKWQFAAIAASGIIILAALAAAIGQEHTTTAWSQIMSIGATTTSTTPAPTPQTNLARPAMKAQRPKGF
jgi:hypothetical protein